MVWSRRLSLLVLSLLIIQVEPVALWGQSAQRVRRGGPPAGAPVFRAGDRFQPSAARNLRGPLPSESRVAEGPSRNPIRRTSAEMIGPEPSAPIQAPELTSQPLPGEYPDDSAVYQQAPWFDDCEACCELDSCAPEALFSCQSRPLWSLGVELTFLKPHFESNPAFTTLEGDGGTQETTTETSFDYDRELAPRIWLEALQCHSLGFRAVYWQFDHPSRSSQGSPPADGLGRITHPDFGNVDLSTTAPGSVFATNSAINAYTIDLEGTQSHDCGPWAWMASAGLRFAEAEQGYRGTLRNAAGAAQGEINYNHLVHGIGPTLSLRTQRPFTPQLALFGFARGSLLYGNGESTLNAVQDQDLDTALTTNSSSTRDDLLPIGELQAGLQWTPPCPGIWHPYFHLALEGQLWGGAGNASSEQGNLGFFGFNVALGMDW